MAVTLGPEVDRQILLAQKRSIMEGLTLDACASVRADALCDQVEAEIAADLRPGEHLTMRFSPGYGDLPLETQRRLFAVLDCPRSIGLTLNDSLIMSPSKSVTALAGVSRAPGEDSSDACSSCSDSGCPYRG